MFGYVSSFRVFFEPIFLRKLCKTNIDTKRDICRPLFEFFSHYFFEIIVFCEYNETSIYGVISFHNSGFCGNVIFYCRYTNSSFALRMVFFYKGLHYFPQSAHLSNLISSEGFLCLFLILLRHAHVLLLVFRSR
jgi:hypothetical protein